MQMMTLWPKYQFSTLWVFTCPKFWRYNRGLKVHFASLTQPILLQKILVSGYPSLCLLYGVALSDSMVCWSPKILTSTNWFIALSFLCKTLYIPFIHKYADNKFWHSIHDHPTNELLSVRILPPLVYQGIDLFIGEKMGEVEIIVLI